MVDSIPQLARHPELPPEVASPYVEAHRACAVTPGYALVQVRAALSRLVDAWLQRLAKGTGGSLSEKAARLVRMERLGRETAQDISRLRVSGNLAAHPEHRRGPPPTQDDARDAIYGIYVLIRLFLAKTSGLPEASLPEFEEPPEYNWGQLCERAFFHHDQMAMLTVSRRLTSEGRSKLDAARASHTLRQQGTMQLEDALTWFERARATTTDPDTRAQVDFERARILLIDLAIPEAQDDALSLLVESAEAGNSDAQALLAILILDPRSPLSSPRDVDEGRRWAELAAQAEHPEALNILTAIHGNGDGVPVDREKALVYARRSSGAGYPLAHANLALLLLEVDDSKIDFMEIRGLVANALAAEVPDAHWAKYLLLIRENRGDSTAALEALEQAATLKVPPALIAQCEIYLQRPPDTWDPEPIVDRLLTALAGLEAQTARARGQALLKQVRDEADRRVRSPGDTSPGPRGDDLFALVIRAGANLDLQPGEDSEERARLVMRSLGRIVAPIGAPASEEDVRLVLAAVPSFPVQWTSTGAKLTSLQTRKESTPPPATRGPRKRPARNQRCPCGSGRRYKSCCGRDRGP